MCDFFEITESYSTSSLERGMPEKEKEAQNPCFWERTGQTTMAISYYSPEIKGIFSKIFSEGVDRENWTFGIPTESLWSKAQVNVHIKSSNNSYKIFKQTSPPPAPTPNVTVAKPAGRNL